MIPALIVCHGQLGQAFKAALAGIYGELTDIEVLSNDGLSAQALENAVVERIEAMGGQGVIFTDYFGGSCATACLGQLSRWPGLYLVSGVNLPTLLYYLAHRHELEPKALVHGIVHRGQNSVRELLPPGL